MLQSETGTGSTMIQVYKGTNQGTHLNTLCVIVCNDTDASSNNLHVYTCVSNL